MKAFVLMPIRKQYDVIYEEVLKPSIEAASPDMSCLRVDKMSLTGSIMRDIIKGITKADVVVADLTGRNPNVFYELGIVHSLCGKTIMITRDSYSNIPFDIKVYRVIQYDPTTDGLEKLRRELTQAVSQIASESSHVSNPVSDFLDANIVKPSPQLIGALLPMERGFAGAFVDRRHVHSVRQTLYQRSTRIDELKIYVDSSHDSWLEDALMQGINRNAKFRFLMCSPDTVETLSGLLAKPAQIRRDVVTWVRKDIEFFRHVIKQLPIEKRDAIQVRLYPYVPAWCLYRYDDQMYVNPYLYGVQGDQTLCIHLKKTEKGPGYFEQFIGHYEEIWHNNSELI